MDINKIQERKLMLEEELRRTERQIYDLEGEYLQARALPCVPSQPEQPPEQQSPCPQETLKDGNILRGWDGYLGKQASSGAIRRINRFREADRMFSASSVTSGSASTFATAKVSPPRPRDGRWTVCLH